VSKKILCRTSIYNAIMCTTNKLTHEEVSRVVEAIVDCRWWNWEKKKICQK